MTADVRERLHGLIDGCDAKADLHNERIDVDEAVALIISAFPALTQVPEPQADTAHHADAIVDGGTGVGRTSLPPVAPLPEVAAEILARHEAVMVWLDRDPPDTRDEIDEETDMHLAAAIADRATLIAHVKALAGMVEGARAERDERVLRSVFDDAVEAEKAAIENRQRAEAELAATLERVRGLEEAIKPFADYVESGWIGESGNLILLQHHSVAERNVRLGDFLRAAALTSGKGARDE